MAPENARSLPEVDVVDATTEVVADHDAEATKQGRPRIFSRDDYTPGRAWR